MDRETELMLKIKEGSKEAFHELYTLYERPLANFLYRLCWNRSLVDDLVQEVLMRVWRAAPNYEPTAKVSTYIFRIAHNLWSTSPPRKRRKRSRMPTARRTSIRQGTCTAPRSRPR